jgi:hypothetical protein
MKCPVCGKDANAKIYHCARCGVYAHTTCWQKHVHISHKK